MKLRPRLPPKARGPRPSSQPYPPELFAAVHDGAPGDIDFYRRVCVGARRVLDLGCGTGRIAAALAADGLDVVGIDQASERVELARRAAPSAAFVVADMRALPDIGLFDRVIIPFTGIYCLTTREDVLKTLRGARERLAPLGMLVFDAYNADQFHAEAPMTGRDHPGLLKTVEALGTTWDVFEHSVWDRASQRIEAIYDHVPRGGAATVRSSILQRYLRSDEVPELLAEAGLELVVLHGDFEQTAYDVDSTMLIATAMAAAEA